MFSVGILSYLLSFCLPFYGFCGRLSVWQNQTKSDKKSKTKILSVFAKICQTLAKFVLYSIIHSLTVLDVSETKPNRLCLEEECLGNTEKFVQLETIYRPLC